MKRWFIMKKNFFIFAVAIFLIVTTLSPLANGILKEYVAYESYSKIFYGHKELEFDSPIVVINDQTYVPLKEIVGKANFDVKWDPETKEIDLFKKRFNVKEIFSYFMGFDLPENSTVTNYQYSTQHDEPRLNAKIAFNEEDLDYITNQMSNISFSEKYLDESKYDPVYVTLSNKLCNEYVWWDITSISDAEFFYCGFKKGEHARTVTFLGLVKKDSTGQYYLYVSR